MELGFTSMAELWRRAESNLRTKREVMKQAYDPKVLESAEYVRWISDAAERHRARGLLLTDQQLKDLKRGLKTGDKVRYVGDVVLEKTSSGANVPRPHGQEGEIVSVTRHSDGGGIYTFQPTITRAMRDSEMGGEVVRLITREWRLFERIV
jgi:hypothetical protein